MTQYHPSALARLSEEFAAMSYQMNRVAGQLSEVERLLAGQVGVPVPPPAPTPAPVHPMVRPTMPPPVPPPPPPPPRVSLTERLAAEEGQGWIGKLLAVAGVAVTLVGVVLLLVLAAQAGILRPEIRVAAGAVLAAGLVGVAVRWNRRAGGRTGAIALAATGVAAAYIDVVAVTTIYEWVAPAIGLLLAAFISGAGLTLARRWDSQHLGLLVLVPLLILAPVVVDGISLLLIGFMLTLSAAALPVQLGRDWIWLHAARTAAATVPLLIVLAGIPFGSGDDPWLLGGACGVAALLAVAGALILLPSSANRVAMALLTVTGTAPVLLAGLIVNRALGALLAAALSALMLAVVTAGRRIPGVVGPVVQIWSALSAVSALIAVTVAFDGYVAAPVLFALSLVTAVAGRHSHVSRWAAIGFATVGMMLLWVYAPVSTLFAATVLPTWIAVSVLAASLLLVACAVAIAWSTRVADEEQRSLWWGIPAVVSSYAVTTFTVTAGVLVAGADGGFVAGHMAATICWIAMAAALFVVALRRPRADRTAPIAGGLALTAAATAKLFLFDLGTLDGMFRVGAFIVVGLVLLGMGAGYARSLVQQDRSRPA
jgi:uncharacterized membrane protein